GGLLANQLGLNGATVENLAHAVVFFLGELSPGLIEPAAQKGEHVDGHAPFVELLEVTEGGLLGVDLTLDVVGSKQGGQPQQEKNSHGAPSIHGSGAI